MAEDKSPEGPVIPSGSPSDTGPGKGVAGGYSMGCGLLLLLAALVVLVLVPALGGITVYVVAALLAILGILSLAMGRVKRR